MERVKVIVSLERSLLLAISVVWSGLSNCYLFLLFTRSSTDQGTNCLCSLSFLQWQNSIIKKSTTFLFLASAYSSGLFLVPQSVPFAFNCTIFSWYWTFNMRSWWIGISTCRNSGTNQKTHTLWIHSTCTYAYVSIALQIMFIFLFRK